MSDRRDFPKGHYYEMGPRGLVVLSLRETLSKGQPTSSLNVPGLLKWRRILQAKGDGIRRGALWISGLGKGVFWVG